MINFMNNFFFISIFIVCRRRRRWFFFYTHEIFYIEKLNLLCSLHALYINWSNFCCCYYSLTCIYSIRTIEHTLELRVTYPFCIWSKWINQSTNPKYWIGFNQWIIQINLAKITEFSKFYSTKEKLKSYFSSKFVHCV